MYAYCTFPLTKYILVNLFVDQIFIVCDIFCITLGRLEHSSCSEGFNNSVEVINKLKTLKYIQ